MTSVDRGTRLAAASRDGHLALRRVERQQTLIERLHAARGARVRLEVLAHELGVSVRTVARDVERLHLSGVPLEARRGRAGGVRLLHIGAVAPIAFDLPEVAALMSSLAVLGPTATESAASAMRKLAAAVARASPPAEAPPPAPRPGGPTKRDAPPGGPARRGVDRITRR
jgi:predicted DNA-binding transcriptional regulator YafY